MNKESKQKQTYLSPKVTVVTFMIEQGFQGSNFKAQPLNSNQTGTEDVTEGNDLSSYFPSVI